MASVLYTPEVLGLAVRLAEYPLSDDLPLRGESRSASCGSSIVLGVLTNGGRIVRVGVQSRACAIGQAAAAIFAGGAAGCDAQDIALAAEAVKSWLAGEAALPDWPGLDRIAAAQAYPARHSAVMLPWRAALQALFAISVP